MPVSQNSANNLNSADVDLSGLAAFKVWAVFLKENKNKNGVHFFFRLVFPKPLTCGGVVFALGEFERGTLKFFKVPTHHSTEPTAPPTKVFEIYQSPDTQRKIQKKSTVPTHHSKETTNPPTKLFEIYKITYSQTQIHIKINAEKGWKKHRKNIEK